MEWLNVSLLDLQREFKYLAGVYTFDRLTEGRRTPCLVSGYPAYLPKCGQTAIKGKKKKN